MCSITKKIDLPKIWLKSDIVLWVHRPFEKLHMYVRSLKAAIMIHLHYVAIVAAM